MYDWVQRVKSLSHRVWLMLALGFSSGLPLALTSTTLQAWLTTTGVSTADIGLFGLVAIPYIYKFIWSPLIDRFSLPYLGRRRGWILLTQLIIIACILVMSLLKPNKHLFTIAILALFTAFIAASQDIAIDAYRTDILEAHERGIGSAMFVGGWRVGAVFSSGLALIIANYAGWSATYSFLAVCMLIGVTAILLSPSPRDDDARAPTSLKAAVYWPFKNFLSRPFALWLLLLIILYKLGDAFALSLTSTFLIRGIGFDLATVGSVFKVFGLLATILGAFLGGVLLNRWKLFPALIIFGLLQAIANIAFISLIYAGKNEILLIFIISFESIAAGMTTTAFMAFLMGLCDHHYTATQYALFSALAAIGRVLLGPLGGIIAENHGWVFYYVFSFILTLPGFLLLFYLKNVITHYSTTQQVRAS